MTDGRGDELGWKPPSEDEVQRVIIHITDLQIAREFFGALHNPLWLAPLDESGCFTAPPSSIALPDGQFVVPYWTEGEYLVRMAPVDPHRVAEILRRIGPPDNVLARVQLIQATAAMPEPEAASLVPDVARTLRLPGEIPHGHPDLIKLLGVLTHVANPQPRRIRQLVEGMFRPTPPRGEAGPGHANPLAGLPDYWFAELLPQAIALLVPIFDIETLTILAGWLKDLAVATGRDPDGDAGAMYWRPSIAPNTSNLRHGIGDALVDATRDLALRIVGDNHGVVEEVITALETPPTTLGRRIAQHVVAHSLEEGVPGALEIGRRRLLDPDNLNRVYLHEYAELTRAVLSADQSVARPWFDLVEADARAEAAGDRALLARSRGVPIEEVSDADIDNLHMQRIRKVLSATEAALPEFLKDRLAALDDALGVRPTEPPDLPVWTQSFIGPTSPTSSEELTEMAADSLMDYLDNWEPPIDVWGAPTREGLGRQLAELLRADPSLLNDLVDRMPGLHPTYVRSIINGWELAAKDGATLEWDVLLPLLEWVAVQPDEGDNTTQFDEDPGWRWSHQEVARFLGLALRLPAGQCPPAEHRGTLWRSIEHLAASPHPSPEVEAEYGGENMDPLTLSLNVVRGQAMYALFAYLSWLSATGQIVVGADPAELAPEVWALIEAHLEPDIDASPAIRAAVGRAFPQLAQVAPEWAMANAHRIFEPHPNDPVNASLTDAAWMSYIASYDPGALMYELLGDIYLARITTGDLDVRLPMGTDRTPTVRLGEHVVLMLAQGIVGIDSPDGLVRAYFASAPAEARAKLLGHVGWSVFQQEAPLLDVVAARLQELWEWRRSEAREEGQMIELAEFTWWFRSRRFPLDWAVRRMAEVAQAADVLHMTEAIAECAAEAASSFPADALAILESLLHDAEPWQIIGIAEHSPPVLAAALRTGDAELAGRVDEMLEALGRVGVDMRGEVS